MYPKRRADLTIREVDGEVIVLNHRLGEIHQLNATASFVWNLCDGQKSVEDIISLVAREYGGSAVEVDMDIRRVIVQFLEKELLVEEGAVR